MDFIVNNEVVDYSGAFDDVRILSKPLHSIGGVIYWRETEKAGNHTGRT